MNELERARAMKEQALKEKRDDRIGLLILVVAVVALFLVMPLVFGTKGGEGGTECANSLQFPAC
jgi:hypothetical protein